jgi:hypothetical protein
MKESWQINEGGTTASLFTYRDDVDELTWSAMTETIT